MFKKILKIMFGTKAKPLTEIPHIRIVSMTPELTPEYLEKLQKEYTYVASCLQYSSQKFKMLVHQGINQHYLQEINNDLLKRKTELETQIYFLRDYLAE